MPLSYASYAGNGSTTSFSVPFPYILKAHVKVYLGFNILNGTYTSELVDGTGFTWTSGTQIQCTTAPAVGQTLTVIRQTPSSSRLVDWNDGSNLIAADLDTADLQNLYVVQEQQDRNDSGITQSTAATAAATAATTAANTATSTANTALSTANTALTNANAAVSTANTASTNASAAVSTANTASTNASAAVTTANAASSTANTASTNASNAVTTANAAAANASTALSTANTALSTANAATSTANTASTNASAAVTTANTASTNASNAVTTANTASTNASAAVSTANTASTNATTAVNTANTANNKADQAIAAVSNSINYQLKANVAAIPASPANDTYIEVQDSTGLESFTPLAGMPAGFVGDSGLSVRLRYTSAGSTWNWLNYYANNSDSRYLKLTGGTLTGQIKADDSTSAATPGYAFDGDPNTGVGRPGADELALITGGTARLTIDSAGNVAVAGALTKGGNNVVTVGDSGTVTSAMLADGTIVNADINAAAAIDKTKISGTAITAADTGTVTSTMIADGAILNADVNAAAAIAGTKISPDFGSQNVTTTGTSTAASYSPTSSTAPTNGVYLPAANTVGISTGGSGRLFVDANGRVGIGGASAAGLLQLKYATDVNTSFRNATAGGLSAGTLIESINDAYSSYNPLYLKGSLFAFGTDSAGAFNERLRITSAGLVGIGTSSPSARLDIATDSGDHMRFIGRGATDYSDIVFYSAANTTRLGYIDFANTQARINVEANVPFRLYTNAQERLTVTAAGNVGIGVNAPQKALHISTPGSTNDGAIQLGGSTYYGTIEHDASSSGANIYTVASASGGGHIFKRGSTEQMRLDASSRLLLGTSSAIAALEPSIQTARSSGAFLALGRDDTSITDDELLGAIYFYGNQGSSWSNSARIEAKADAAWGTNDYPSKLVFSTTADGASSPTERVRITNNGYFKATNSGTYVNTAGTYHEFSSNYNDAVLLARSTIGAGYVSYIIYADFSYAPNNTTAYFLYFGDSSAKRMDVRSNGGIANFQANNVNLSDINAKKDISLAAGTWDCIKEWEIVNYRYKDQPDDADLNLGVIAQQVAESCPEVITVFEEAKEAKPAVLDEDGNEVEPAQEAKPEKLGIKEQQMYWMAIKALQEAQVRIEALEATNADLLARVTALESA